MKVGVRTKQKNRSVVVITREVLVFGGVGGVKSNGFKSSRYMMFVKGSFWTDKFGLQYMTSLHKASSSGCRWHG